MTSRDITYKKLSQRTELNYSYIIIQETKKIVIINKLDNHHASGKHYTVLYSRVLNIQIKPIL